MNDELATAEESVTESDADQNARGEQSSDESAQVGITDDDMAQIRSFLAKYRQERSVDDLRPSER